MAIDYKSEVDSGFDRKRIVESSIIQLLKDGIPVDIVRESPYFNFNHNELLRNISRGYERKVEQVVEIYTYYGIVPEEIILGDRYAKVSHPVGGELYPFTEEEQKAKFMERIECVEARERLVKLEQKRLLKEKEKALKMIARYKTKYPIIDVIIDLVNEMDTIAINNAISSDEMIGLFRKYNLSPKNNEKYNTIYNEYQRLIQTLDEITKQYEQALEGHINNPEYNALVEKQKGIETEIIQRNTKLVNAFIRQKYGDLLIDQDELFQTCYIAMWEAAKEYNPKSGNFSTYAYACMDIAVKDSFKELTGLKWDHYWGKKKISRLLEIVKTMTGHNVTVSDLLEYGLISMSSAKAYSLYTMPEEYDMSDLFDLSDKAYDEHEIDMEYEYYHGDDEPEDFVPYLSAFASEQQLYNDVSGDNPAENAYKEALKTEIRKVLGYLNEREQKVITLRFGLEDGICRSLEYVGEQMGVSRTRIRDIEAKALRQLFRPARAKNIDVFVK